MIAAVWKLSRDDCAALKITDAYSIHRVVYNIFPDVRTTEEKNSDVPSGIQYVDKGGDRDTRTILLLANREPNEPEYGELERKPVPPSFLEHGAYAFTVTMNPTKRDKKSGKTIAIKGSEDLAAWFCGKTAGSWGFEVDAQKLSITNIGASIFNKSEHTTVTHNRATFSGVIRVVNSEKFKCAFTEGIGRARAFGFGLLELVPLQEQSRNIK